jgi:oxaloacetate decarboxylase alpha subunit
MAGLLTPYVAYELTSKIKKVVNLPIDLHCHYTSGMASATYIKAIEAGVDIVDTAISSLALATSQPPTESIVAILKDTPYDTGLDLNLLSEIAKYFANIRDKYKEFETKLKGVDVNVLIFQIPGGMWSNMEKQLKDQNALDRLPEVLEELPRVRKDMGYPPLVTPTSQIVGTQAVLNVISGGRYKILTKETKEYLKGKYGKPPGEVNEDLLKLALDDEERITCRPADLIEPEFEKIKKELGDRAKNTEDVLTYALFPEVAIKLFEQREKPSIEEKVEIEVSEKGEIPPSKIQRGGIGRFRVKVGDKSFDVEVEELGYARSVKSLKESPVTPYVPQRVQEGNEVKSLFQGNILKIKCKVGDIVKADDVLIVMEAMKMEIQIKASSTGKISSINVSVGDSVKAGDVLATISS